MEKRPGQLFRLLPQIIWPAKDPSHPPGAGGPRSRPQYWNPFFLRRGALLGFASVAASLAITLGILAWYSKRNDGLSTAESREHYLWTYGPTAVFTLLAVFWSQTEYRAKQLQPWINLQHDWKLASQSVLLDYISQWNVFAFFRALRAGHLVATLAILGSLLLKLVIVLSTGLIVLQNTAVTDNDAPLIATEKFGVANPRFWRNQTTNLDNLGDFRPTTVVLAMLKDKLAIPKGTTSHLAFQRFAPVDGFKDHISSYRASVDVFESSLHCEPAMFEGGWIWPYGDHPYWNATSVSSESCQSATPRIVEPYPGFVWDGWEFDRWGVYSSYTVVHCSNPETYKGKTSKRMLFFLAHLDRTTKHRVLNSTVPDSHTNSDAPDFADVKLSPNFTTLLCFPEYGLYRSPVTIDQDGNGRVTSSSIRGDSRSMEGFDAWNLADAFLNSITGSRQFINEKNPSINDGSSWSDYTQSTSDQNSYFWELLNIAKPQDSVLDWMNTTLVNTTLQSVWSMWSAQMAAFQLKEPANLTVPGTIVKMQPRLLIQPVAFWLIEAVLLVIIVLAVAMAVLTPQAILPRDPSSLGGLGTIMASSTSFQGSLRNMWRYGEQRLLQTLSRCLFSTRAELPTDRQQHRTFSIKQKLTSRTELSADMPQIAAKPWWQPFAASYLYMVAAPLVLLVLILLLEGLYQLSARNNGIVAVSDSSPTKYLHFTWTAIPALVMVLTAAIVGMLNFTLQTLQPYQHLKRGSATARNGMFKYPYSVLEAVRDRDYAIILAATAVLLGSLLTIVISGLYTVHPVSATQTARVQQTDWFKDRTNLTNGGPIQIESVTVGNLSYPRFTYENLVFPAMNVTPHATGNINLRVPALQGIMNCSIYPSEDIMSINNTWFNGSGWQDVLTIFVKEEGGNCLEPFMTTSPLAPPNCNHASCYALPKRPVIEIDMRTLPYASDSADFRQSYMIIPTTGYFGYLNIKRNSPLCPQAVGVVGKTNNHLIEESAFFTCSPYASKVQVNATFLLPAMDIDQSAPPTLIAGSSEPFDVKFPPIPEHGAPLVYWPSPLLAFQQILLPPMVHDEMFGPFMDILVYGKDGIPANELTGSENVPRLLSSMDYLYGVGFAQLMDLFRKPVEPNTILLNGTRSFQGPYRLFQGELSTRILEGLLGAILICMLVAFFFMDTRKVLKLNPCSIAGMASLLAGSELLSNIPEGAEWWSDEQLLKHPSFDGWVFSLGWWPVLGGDKRFGVDIGQADVKP